MTKLIDAKRNKGYKEVNKTDLDRVYPEFEQDLEQTAVWAMLSA
jgi:predicted DNA-binding WGR domain protein